MKTITLTYKQVSYVFNDGVFFKFNASNSPWMKAFDEAFGAAYDNVPTNATGLTVLTANMNEEDIKRMMVAMDWEASSIAHRIEEFACAGKLEERDWRLNSIVVVSSIIAALKQAR